MPGYECTKELLVFIKHVEVELIISLGKLVEGASPQGSLEPRPLLFRSAGCIASPARYPATEKEGSGFETILRALGIKLRLGCSER